MSEERDSRVGDEREEENTSQSSSNPGGGRKFSKVRFLLLFFLLLSGVLVGLHFSGAIDLRPSLYKVVPRIPIVGKKLSQAFSIPEVYALTVEERRRMELQKWNERLNIREKELSERTASLEALSSDLATRLVAVRRREVALEDREDKAEEPLTQEEGKYFDRVVRTYQEISSRKAAKIVERLDGKLAVKILKKVPEDVLAGILGRMDVVRAAWLTEQLARGER